MRKNRGFTLIEVMVVLSILALVAILAYNFFGSTMKEARYKQAVTKVNNDLRVLADAYELYEMKVGESIVQTDAPGGNYISLPALGGSLVTQGFLKRYHPLRVG